MRDLLISPKGHGGAFDPDSDNATRRARVPILLLEATTLNTGHDWRFEAMYVGEPPRQYGSDGTVRADIDKNTILERTRWDDLPEACQDFPLGAAVVSSACFPGGHPPTDIAGIFDGDLLVKLVDGGVHDNQGIEGLRDRSCTHLIISDGSGQMPDRVRPSTRTPAVLRTDRLDLRRTHLEERLLAALEHPDNTALFFMHLQSGLPAPTRKAGEQSTTTLAPPRLESGEFGVQVDVQRALANIRTDLDAFCDLEAWALMADGYQLAGRIVPRRSEIAALGQPAGEVGWAFSAVSGKLAQNPPDPHFLKVLQVGKERFLRPARMVRHGYAATNILIALLAAAAVAGLWPLLTPHGTALFIAGLGCLAALVVYFASDKAYVKPVAVVVFDTSSSRLFLPSRCSPSQLSNSPPGDDGGASAVPTKPIAPPLAPPPSRNLSHTRRGTQSHLRA